MQGVKPPIVKDVVLVGAGHAHVAVLRRFGMQPMSGVRLTLITREVHTPYSGMLPGLVAGHYTFDEAHIDTGPLVRFAGGRLFQDEVTGIDRVGGRVFCRNRPPVPYDVLSLNIGSTPNTADVPGAEDNAIPVKPIDGFLEKFEALLSRVKARQGPVCIALVGGGAGGVELLLSIERRLRSQMPGSSFGKISYRLVTDTDDILPTFPVSFRERFRTILLSRQIEITTKGDVARVEPGRLVLASGTAIEADEVLWTTQAAPARWLAQTGFPLDERGFLKVDEYCRVPGEETVFAAGDTISFGPRPIPKSGVYSVRSGPIIAENIRRVLGGRRLKPFRPQRRALYLVSNGEKSAIGTRNGIVVSGRWVWRWKDWIDRRFMDRFNRLPEMKVDAPAVPAHLADRNAIKELSAIAMRCGGCGAKVGATVLSRALGTIEPVSRPDILVGLDSPDDAAIVDTGGDALSVQTVDYFRAIVDDPYMFGKIAANHALGDIYAKGGEPQSALAIATIPYGLEAKVEADLTAMMTGANEILRDANCALVGGHTSEGAELSLGFALNGLVARGKALQKTGLQAGDALILTKPIGTGTLLAADMRGKAKARWVAGAIAHMIHSNREAARVLREHGAHASTDVTGFGLIGHLVEMVRASAIDASIAIDRVPILPGARESVENGIFSSLQPQNVRLRRAIRNLEAASAHPLFPLLFDPQTAGGLLAGIPAERTNSCLSALRAAGCSHATVIGLVTTRSDALEPITIELGKSIVDTDFSTSGRDHSDASNHAKEPV